VPGGGPSTAHPTAVGRGRRDVARRTGAVHGAQNDRLAGGFAFSGEPTCLDRAVKVVLAGR
jgi:hypothetical protein